MTDKGLKLLAFLQATATIRRGRISSYGPGDKVLWLAEVPKEHAECRSPFLSDKPDDLGEFVWLQVQKKRMPIRPPAPQIVADWVRAEELDQPDRKPELLPEIKVVVERQEPDPDAPLDRRRMIVKQVSEVRRLADHPEIEEAWRKYLIEKWEPWAQEMRRWQEVQSVYEALDFMRRRLEAEEERYELQLAIGYLQWRDPTGTAVARHVLTAPAELSFDAGRGLFMCVPAASFDGFRIELDMLEPQHRPRLNNQKLGEQLEALDIQAWDFALVAPILQEIANSLHAGAVVEDMFWHAERIEERPRLSFAPAIVLRERRPTAYEDLIRRFLEAATGDGLDGTPPWFRLLREGEPMNTHSGSGENNPSPLNEDRLLFPLPTNKEQREIAYRLQRDPCVLVKGPPGTGKSHTIANLICHLLATGNRVLVAAHAPKALAVLRDLLPGDIGNLCVTALGFSREDQRLLEESVRGILRRRNEWQGPTAAQKDIEEAEGELRKLEDELAQVERDLRIFREAETHTHELPGGYSGTAARIARAVSEQEHEFGWFPELPAEAAFPLDPLESEFLADAHASFTADARAELDLEIGAVVLPDPNDISTLTERLIEAENRARQTCQGVGEARIQRLDSLKVEELRNLRDALQGLSELALRAERVLGELSETILKDLLASADSRWTRHLADSATLQHDAKRLLEVIGSVRIELPANIPLDQLKSDVDRRLAHLEAGGCRGFSIFAPKVIRETRYIVQGCRVAGKKTAQVEQLRQVRDYLELQHKVHELRELWGTSLAEDSSIRQTVSLAEDLNADLRELLAFFRSEPVGLLLTILGSDRIHLVDASERNAWLEVFDAALAIRDARDLQRQLDQLLETVRTLRLGSKAHPCLRELERAIRERDATAWRTAWQKREQIRQEKQRLTRFETLLKKIDESCPSAAELLRSTAGEPNWRDRVRKMREAWNWAAARAWVQRFSHARDYETRVRDYHCLRQKIEKVTEHLVSHRAWKAFFERLDTKTVQCLTAWTKAVNRIGKGTGKHAYRHRRTARKYLMECVHGIPAWIMPLHKLWDSVEAVPGLFDTVIVDEASQAGTEALLLLLLAKRIVVVGDDKQNSPEAVGILEEDIARLARELLNGFRFRDEYRPDTSLFDHAERTFGGHITLREHFRCVPEIIRFSNDLCYRDTPLIPLRQAPPERLEPLRAQFVAKGACEGDGQRLRNRAEAEAIVETIEDLVGHHAYKGKTMGVIALQGHAQAQLIETILAQKLNPEVIEERRLRCGEPATFQGDQRDIMFLSLVIAPNVNYRALTRLQDQRRFNVAMSRARDQVWLFHSVKSHDLSPDDLRHRLLTFFENPQVVTGGFEELERLEREAKGYRHLGTQPDPYESWFEVDVALELIRRKYRVRPQVEVAGYRIDIVVEGQDARLAVECDGDAWHGPEQYERDMARQRQIERAGWTFVRVRESDFYVNRKQAIDAVVRACDKLGIRP